MKYLVAVFGVFILVILGVILLTRGKSKKPVTTTNQTKLIDYRNNTEAKIEYYTEGPIVAKENHYAYRITISPNARTMDVMKGYEGEVVRTKTYDNTPNALGAFLEALGRTNFTRTKVSTAKYDAICSGGWRSTFKLTNNGDDVVDSWTASCSAGTFGGNLGAATTLIKGQVPDYGKLTNGVNLGSSASDSGLTL
jgi:hypothetical protein